MKEYKNGDYIIVKNWKAELSIPMMIKCFECDNKNGIIYFLNGDKKQNIKFSDIRKANLFEKFLYWIFI